MEKPLVYVDSDGSRYCQNFATLSLCAVHVRKEGDIFWETCMGLIADWNTSRKALGMPTIKNPKAYLRQLVKSCS